MRQSRFTEDEKFAILQEAEAEGASIREVCERHGISLQTYYRWRKRYWGMQDGEVLRLRELEAENARLKRLLAESALEVDALKETLQNKD